MDRQKQAQFFVIWMANITRNSYFTSKIPEFNWIIQNYSSFDHKVSQIS